MVVWETRARAVLPANGGRFAIIPATPAVYRGALVQVAIVALANSAAGEIYAVTPATRVVFRAVTVQLAIVENAKLASGDRSAVTPATPAVFRDAIVQVAGVKELAKQADGGRRATIYASNVQPVNARLGFAS